VHDPIEAGEPLDARGGFRRLSNNAGGLEGGMTTGEPLVVRVAMKPISTLMSPLRTVNLSSVEPANAQSERSDVTAVPAMGVIAEAWSPSSGRCDASSAAITGGCAAPEGVAGSARARGGVMDRHAVPSDCRAAARARWARWWPRR
jgi:hypothetical protein